MLVLKKLLTILGMLSLGFAGGGLVGFVLGYGITGNDRGNPHGGLILVALLTIGGALLGLILGAITAYRVGSRAT